MSEPNEFFTTPEISAHLDLIRHLIENSELVPLVKGTSGSGKSLMASKLQQSAPEEWVVCHFSAEPTLQPERLLAFIARCNGLPDIAGDLLQRLVARFEVMRKRGRIPVILVDDAQMLPPTSLMTLLRLFERQTDGVRLVSIVLFANEQIDHLLATPQLQVMSPQAIQAIDMPVLTPREAVDFMHFVLKGEGLSEHFALDDTKLARVYKETGGVPGLMASEILNDVGHKGEAQASIFRTYRQQLVMYGAPLLVVVVLLLLFQGAINQMFEPDELEKQAPVASIEPQAQPVESIRLPLPEQPDTRIASLPMAKPVARSGSADAVAERSPEPLIRAETQPEPSAVSSDAPTETVPHEKAEVGEQKRPQSVPETRIAETDAASVETTPLPEQEAEKTEVRVPDPGEAAPLAPEEPVAQIQASPSNVAERVPETPKASPVTVRKNPPEKAVAPAEPAETVSDEAQVEPDAALSLAEAPAKPQTSRDDARTWIAEQSPESYTLQLIAVENIESLQRFISINGLQGKVHTHQTQRKGVPWYSLLWGSFANREAALEAQTQLPPTVQKGGVWARSFGSLQ
ncbi:MAG: AAA family ATPase [Candidatus Thiodiazotropha sp.]